MGGEWKEWCDRCGEDPRVRFCDLSTCEVCHVDVCNECSYKSANARVCNDCSSGEKDCYECDGRDDCGRCETNEGLCMVVLCKSCASWTKDENGKRVERLCDDHICSCSQCDAVFNAGQLTKCKRDGCTELLCEDCGTTFEDSITCTNHIAGVCNRCDDRIAETDDLFGCTECGLCCVCETDEHEPSVCSECGFSHICTLCLDGNPDAGEACNDCLGHIEDGDYSFLDDDDYLLRLNAYAHKNQYVGALHPDEAAENLDGLRSCPPLPKAAAPDQRVLVKTQDNHNLTAWGDIKIE